MGAIADFFRWAMQQVGFAICHQLPDRAYSYGGRALPVCARDTGLFLGFTLAFLLLLLVYRKSVDRYPSWPVVLVLCALVVPTVVDGVTSYATLRETSNLVRISTGALAGAALAALLFPLACSRLFPGKGHRRMMEHWWHVLVLLPVPVAISLLVPLGGGWAYWLWAPLVTLSIFFTLLVLNYTLFSLIFEWARRDVPVPGAAVLAAVAVCAVVVELVASNRLHWLLNRLIA